MAAPGFWDDQEKARETITVANRIKGWVEPWKELDEKVGDLKAMAELLEEEEDEELVAEWERGLAKLEAGVETLPAYRRCWATASDPAALDRLEPPGPRARIERFAPIPVEPARRRRVGARHRHRPDPRARLSRPPRA